MANRRMERINQLILEEVASVIQNDLSDPNIGFATITSVDTSNDLSQSIIYVSIFGEPDLKSKSCAALNHAASFIRNAIAPHLKLRYIPKLFFRIDNSADKAFRIEKLLSGKEL